MQDAATTASAAGGSAGKGGKGAADSCAHTRHKFLVGAQAAMVGAGIARKSTLAQRCGYHSQGQK